ncbi:hypothetical protein ACLOJK_018917 [Asimina triloba]
MGERGGGVVLASRRVEVVMGRRTRADAGASRPWAKASSRLWTESCTSRRGGGSVGRWVASHRLDGVHMMKGLDLQMEGSLVTETKTEAFEEKWMMARFRSEMGDDRSGMKMNSLMTGEEDLPRVATVINFGLRPQRIWNELDVSDVMSGSDGPSGRSPAVGSDGQRWRGVFFIAVDDEAMHGLTDDGSVMIGQRALIGGCRWWLCIASPAGKEVADGSHVM